MPCAQCPHCNDLATLANLRLDRRPRAGGQGGVDRAFYRDYASVYALACARSSRPGVLLRQANPGLTASQCRDYLRRARELGFVDRQREPVTTTAPLAGETTRQAPAPAGTADQLAPEMREWLASARAATGIS